MTYRVGEFIPSDRAEIGESTLPLELFLSCWNPKDAGVSRGTQWTGRDVKAKKIRQVQRSSISDIIVQGGNFVIDSLSYWKPVQFSRKWWKVCAIGGFENESSRTVLNLLKFVNQLLRNPWQQEITVLKAWQNQGCHKGFGSINCEDMSNWANFGLVSFEDQWAVPQFFLHSVAICFASSRVLHHLHMTARY